MSVSFHQTQMGHRFFEATVPALVRELERLNDNLERLAALLAPPAPGADDELAHASPRKDEKAR